MLPPSVYTSLIYLYKSTGDPDFFSVTNMKTALAKALVSFYPLAGWLSTDKDGRLEIDCNGKGALFVVARSKLTFHQLREYVPSVENRKLFVPIVDSDTPPLLLLQVTFLKSSDVVLGVAFKHCVVGLHSDLHFMQTLTNIVRGNTSIVPPPFLDRSLLRARSSPFCSSNHPLVLHVQYLKSLGHTGTYPPLISTTLELSREQIDHLKNQPGRRSTSGTISTFHVVSAHIWKCLCLARHLSPDKETHLLFPVKISSRISPPLPKYFFGNTNVSGFVSAKVSEVIEFISERIRESVVRIDDAHVREFIDYMEVADEESLSNRLGITTYDMIITSWLGAPCYDANFGYGNPVFVTRASAFPGFAVLMNNPGKDQGISVLIGLEAETMEQFKEIFYDLISIR